MTDDRIGPGPEPDTTFLGDFAALSAIGATPGGGVERLAGSMEDRAARDWLVAWMRERDLEVRIDAVGNLFGLLELVPGAPYVAVGSHIDSQPLGGRYDGAYGVLAAAHAVDRIRRHVARHGTDGVARNLVVVDWFNEEGARFAPSMMGSAVLAGLMQIEVALGTVDGDGATVRDALAATGYLGGDSAPEIAAYAEIHVEQGRILEDDGVTIGLVESTWAARKYEVVVTGEQSHTGSTVVADRRDALVGAARLIVAAREQAERHDGADGSAAVHTSVAELAVLPNSPVVVPREVRMNLDLRSPDPELLDRVDARMRDAAAEIDASVRVSTSFRLTHRWDVQAYQPEGVRLAASAAAALGLDAQPMQTIAGHDSTNMRQIVPTVMLFVPSVEGIAHNEGELTSEADCLAGVDLLTEVLARLQREDGLVA